jgi:signal transduction histidine kinase
MNGQSIFSIKDGLAAHKKEPGYGAPPSQPVPDAARPAVPATGRIEVPAPDTALAVSQASGAVSATQASGSQKPLALQAERLPKENVATPPPARPPAHRLDPVIETVFEDFGQILRHELNNPLTGILGNAELLLAEIRRSGDDRIPRGGPQRLETIAALAVRMRETIRRISQEWLVEGSVARKKSGS